MKRSTKHEARSTAPAPRGRAGFSLVELLVASMIIVIIFIAWLRIANFQAVRKESLRRLAIEKAAGYLDVMAELRPGEGTYQIVFDPTNSYTTTSAQNEVVPLFEDQPGSPGYVLRVMPTDEITDILAHDGWPDGRWAIIQLYDEHGVPTNEAGRVFSTMSVYLQ